MEFEVFKKTQAYLTLAAAILIFILVLIFIPPLPFPSGSIITVSEGTGLQALSQELKDGGVIRSSFWFRTFAIVLGGERDMKAGQYYMPHPQSPFVIAWRILHGNYGVETVKITIPEGFTTEKIDNLFDKRFVLFDHKEFLDVAPESYLFPDTYFIPVTATASSTVRLLNDNFYKKISPLIPEITSSKKILREIIIIASLIEAEAKTRADREVVSNILWKRLKLGMPLQVDSEMGTYEFKGLPEKPINYPGLVSVEAALRPTSTPYLYFLSGHDGAIHYAKTFEEHKKNIAKYLTD